MDKALCGMVLILSCIFLSLTAPSVKGEVASCQTGDGSIITSCMEFASSRSIPASLEKTCNLKGARNVGWVKSPCPRAGTIGYCEIPRKDTMTQVVYCYRSQGVPDKQKLQSCKQVCKGRFGVY